MQLLTAAFTVLMGLAAASPDSDSKPTGEVPTNVKIHGISFLGSGCPKGSADLKFDNERGFVASFPDFIVKTGNGTAALDWRKNCKLTVNLEYDQGFQFSVPAVTISGSAEIPKGVTGTCKNVISFTAAPLDKSEASSDIKGQFSGPFTVSSDTVKNTWSPCGSTAILNINTQCFVNPTNLQATINVQEFGNVLGVVYPVKWRRC